MVPNPLAARNRENHQTASFNITDQLTRFSFQQLGVQMEGEPESRLVPVCPAARREVDIWGQGLSFSLFIALWFIPKEKVLRKSYVKNG